MKECEPFTCRVHIAGDYDTARQVVREFVTRGACVSLTQVDYIYTMGEERGLCATIINYPRFPSTPDALTEITRSLGSLLCERLNQGSYTIETPIAMEFYSRRGDDAS